MSSGTIKLMEINQCPVRAFITGHLGGKFLEVHIGKTYSVFDCSLRKLKAIFDNSIK